MRIRLMTVACAAALAASISVSYAGPCRQVGPRQSFSL
jgi:hypothetical protein